MVIYGVIRLHLHETVARRLCNSKNLYYIHSYSITSTDGFTVIQMDGGMQGKA